METSVQTSYNTYCQRQDRVVVRSNRVIWSICEGDVLAVARERGIQLTEDQLDDAARYVEKGLSAVCNWFMLLEMVLNEVAKGKTPGSHLRP